MTEYSDDLVERVRTNRDAYNTLLQTQLGLDSELDSARITYEIAREKRNVGERIGGWAVRLVKKSTPTLQTMWDAEVDIERLEGLLETNSSNQDAVIAGTDSAISSYLAGTSELFREYLAGRETAARAIAEGESYLSLVSMVKNDVDYLSWMVWRDWPYMHDPWGCRRPYPPHRCRPPRRWSEQMSRLEDEELSMGIRGDSEIGIMGIMGEDGEVDFMSDDYAGDDGMGTMDDDDISILGLGIGLEDDDDDSRGSGGRGGSGRRSGGRGRSSGGDGGMGFGLHDPEVPDFSPPDERESRGSGGREKRGDDDAPVDIGFGLYDPKTPDFSPPDRRQPHRHPRRRRPCRPCPPRRRYWHGYWWRRRWALQEAQEGVNRVKARKPAYVIAMEQYALNRSKHLNELPADFTFFASLSAIKASYVDDLPWYSAFAALPFMLAMDRVSAQLSPIQENVRKINTVLNSDLSQLESKIAGEVARVRSEILSD